MRRLDVETQFVDQSRQPRGLTLRQVEDQPRQRRGVDDRVLERAFQAPPHKPAVEGVVAVLDQHSAVRKAQEGASRILELRSPDQHRAVDVMALAGVGVDGRPAVDEGVEERKRAGKTEPLGAHLKHQERRVARRLHVQGDEFGVLEPGLASHLARVDGDLLPGNRLGRPAWLQEERLGAQPVIASARRAQPISSRVTARVKRRATT
jgi:hypothetical protein